MFEKIKAWIKRKRETAREQQAADRLIKHIEQALGFELYEWQRLYIITGIWQPPEGRLHGRTTAYILRLLLDQSKPLLLYEFSQVAAYADNPFMERQYQPVPMQYAGWFRHEIRSIYEQLRTAGVVVLAIVCDTVFGVLRAIKEKKFNSCAGIDGAIRKVGMLISLVFMLAIDVLIKINLIGFIPEQARTYLGLDTVGVAEFFALLYIAYEVVSIFKNMALCGLPVKKVWEKVREFLAKYTDELPDTDELDGDSTTGNVEEHRTQER